jgi:hypothetical protein
VRFDLASMTRRLRNPRRKSIPIRDIAPTAVLAGDLYRSAYAPVISTLQASADRIAAEYGRTLAEVTTDSAADLGLELDGLKVVLDRLLLTLTPRLRDWVLRAEQWHRGKWRGAVLSATGVDINTMIGPQDVAQPMEAIVEWNVALIRDVGDQARQRIASAVFAGLNERRAATDVAKDIRAATGMARDRSLRIASDQLTKLTASLDGERMTQAGIEEFIYRHSGKLHPRSWHRARDGRHYDLSTFEEVGGGETIAADDRPGVPPFCGCRKQGVVTFD